MIWSVSTSARSRKLTPALDDLNRLHRRLHSRMSTKRPSIAAAAAIFGETRCVRPPLPWRPSKLRFEVEAQRSPGLRMSGFIPRHIEQPAERQSKPAARKTSSSPSASASALTCAEPGTTIALSVLGDPAALDHRGGLAQVADPRVRARADEHPVELDLADRPTRLEVHVAQRPLLGLASAGSGTAPVTSTTWPGFVPQVTIGESDEASTSTSASKLAPSSVGSSRQRADRGVEVGRGAARRPSTHSKVVSSGAIIPARPPPSIVMLQIVIRFSIVSPAIVSPGVLDRVADHAAGAEPADRRQDHVLGGDPVAELARVGDPHRLRPLLHQALGREHVLDLRGADPEGERAEGAVGRGVAVAADDRQPGLGEPELGADHVHDPLAVGAERVERDPELLAVSLQRLDLDPRELVGDQPRGRRAVGGHVVVGGRDVLSGRRTLRPSSRRPSKACGEVTSWTRCRSM